MSNNPANVGTNPTRPTGANDEHWKKYKIYKIPEYEKALNPGAYSPQLVFIGPYNHGKAALQPMEEHKARALQRFVGGGSTNINKCCQALESKFDELISSYQSLGEEWKGSSLAIKNRFLMLMVKDGVFLYELMRGYPNGEGWQNKYDKQDPIFSVRAMRNIPSIVADILMLENQLPITVLERLIAVEKENLGGEHHAEVNELVLNFLHSELPPQNILAESLGLHVLDISRKVITRKFERTETNQEYNTDNDVKSAIKFDDVGVKFRRSSGNPAPTPPLSTSGTAAPTPPPSTSGNPAPNPPPSTSGTPAPTPSPSTSGNPAPNPPPSTSGTPAPTPPPSTSGNPAPNPPPSTSGTPAPNPPPSTSGTPAPTSSPSTSSTPAPILPPLTFDRTTATLSLPLLTFDTTTEARFLNAIAFECLHPDTSNEVRSYIAFLRGLIASPRDVEFLRSKELIDSKIGDDQDIDRLLKTISNNVLFDPSSDMSNLKNCLNKYYKDHMRTWKRLWRESKRTGYENYWKNPWKIIALSAATVALILTLLQTIYTIMGKDK